MGDKKQIKICKICGEEFKKQRNKKTCSIKCSKENSARLTKDMQKRKSSSKEIKKCKVCGKDFEASGMSKICSKECRKANLKLMKEAITLKCIVCGEEFIQITHTQKCCTKECYKIFKTDYYSKRRNPNYTTDRVCVICGKSFTSRLDKIVCSEECYKERMKYHQKKSDGAKKSYALQFKYIKEFYFKKGFEIEYNKTTKDYRVREIGTEHWTYEAKKRRELEARILEEGK